MVGQDGSDGQAGEDRDLSGKRGRAGFEMARLEIDLCGFEARLQQVKIGVDAGFDALLLDAQQVGRIRFLLARCGKFGLTVSSSM